MFFVSGCIRDTKIDKEAVTKQNIIYSKEENTKSKSALLL